MNFSSVGRFSIIRFKLLEKIKMTGKIKPNIKNIKSHNIKSHQENTRLAEQMKQGDVEAFRLLFQKHQKWIYGKIYNLIRNHQDTEEVCQDAFLKVWMNIHQWDAAKGTLKAWLNVLVFNVTMDFLRRQNRRKKIRETLLTEEEKYQLKKLVSLLPQPDEKIERQETEFEIRKLFLQMLGKVECPDNQKEAFKLRYLDDLDVQETSKALDCNPNTTRIWTFRCKNQLKNILTKQDFKILMDKV